MAHYIQGVEVTEAHIGRPVFYLPPHANGDVTHPSVEQGVISSFSEETLWVRFKAPNGASVNPDRLVWDLFENYERERIFKTQL